MGSRVAGVGERAAVELAEHRAGGRAVAGDGNGGEDVRLRERHVLDRAGRRAYLYDDLEAARGALDAERGEVRATVGDASARHGQGSTAGVCTGAVLKRAASCVLPAPLSRE